MQETMQRYKFSNLSSLGLVAGSVAVSFLLLSLILKALSVESSFLQDVIYNYTYLGPFLLLLLPPVAYGVLKARCWGWYLFIIFSLLLAGFSIYQLQFHVGQLSFYLIIGFNILNFAGVSLFVSESIRTPYFSLEDRGWRLSRRVPLSLPLTVTVSAGSTRNIETRTLDVSDTGLSFKLDTPLEPGTGSMGLHIQVTDAEKIHLKGEFIRQIHSESGWHVGVRFSSENDVQTTDRFRKFLKERYTNRYGHRLKMQISGGGNSLNGLSYNISRTGCFFEIAEFLFQKGDPVDVTIQYPRGNEVVRKGEIVWKNTVMQPDGKGTGYGIKFTDKIYSHPHFAWYYYSNVRKSPLKR